MKHVISVLAASCVLLLVLASGCADVTATQKVGDFGTAFGTSSDEQKAIDWFKTTYGDPLTNNDQPARFLEPLITTGLSKNNMPVDKVTTFPVSGGSVYFFVIYDNFKKGDPITVSWVYMENGREVTKVEKQAGGDFGRFIVEFQKPDSGWGKGNQKIMVSGSGATSSVNFAMGDSLQTTPLPYSAGSGAAKTTPAQVNAVMTVAQQTLRGSALTTVVGTPVTKPTPDVNKDPKNCGKVGNVCPDVKNAKAWCGAGTCQYSCIFPWDYNDGGVAAPINPSVGCTYNTNTDGAHCGGYGHYCKGTEVCQDGTCVSTCTNGKKGCGHYCADLKTDISNCGSCGKKCPVLPNAITKCANSQCDTASPPVCEVGFGNCDGRRENGCEEKLIWDNNCGICGHGCNWPEICLWGGTWDHPTDAHCGINWESGI